MRKMLRNWAESFTFGGSRVHHPKTVGEIQEIVRRANKVKALGTRHSFSRIADTDGELVSMAEFDQIEDLELEKGTVTVQPGVRYGELSRYLCGKGVALHNLASLPHISVAGACATATHGSGLNNPSLASAVVGIEFVLADGSSLKLDKKNSDFEGAVVHLGALGIVTRLRLKVSPSFSIRQFVFQLLPLDTALEGFQEIMGGAYSVSLFTDWSSDRINQVWVKQHADEALASVFCELEPASTAVHPIEGMPAEFCTEQLGIEGPWNERLPHFRQEFTPSSGDELQSEYLVPIEYAAHALRVVNGIREKISPWLHISEIRTIAADLFWMSPFYGTPRIGIHFTWKKEWQGVRSVLPQIEAALKPFKPRPHWGKLFTMGREEIGPIYERIDDFRDLAQRMDPEGKFRNTFLEEVL